MDIPAYARTRKFFFFQKFLFLKMDYAHHTDFGRKNSPPPPIKPRNSLKIKQLQILYVRF